MAEILVAGISSQQLPGSVQQMLEEKPCHLACSRSLFALVTGCIPGFQEKDWTPVTPLDACFKKLKEFVGVVDIVVLTSGDPLFYGLGTRLKKEFAEAQIRFLPAVSSMQLCFSRFGMTWQDADFISLHGRPLNLLDTRLNSEKLFIYTDPKNSPDLIARHLITRLDSADLDSCLLHIGTSLGNEDEQLVSAAPAQIGAMSFSQPNCMIYENPKRAENKNRPGFGLREMEISHSRGLITKDEVRSAVIHKLLLPGPGVFWDIGAGSGSISIEAARLSGSLIVYSVEKEEEQLNHIRTNKARFQCRNLLLIAGRAPAVLQDLPRPDRVFIGGSGGALAQIIEHLAQLMAADAVVVITAVLEKTAVTAPELLHRHGFEVDISLLQTTRLGYPEGDQNLLNPIYIIRGRKTS